MAESINLKKELLTKLQAILTPVAGGPTAPAPAPAPAVPPVAVPPVGEAINLKEALLKKLQEILTPAGAAVASAPAGGEAINLKIALLTKLQKILTVAGVQAPAVVSEAINLKIALLKKLQEILTVARGPSSSTSASGIEVINLKIALLNKLKDILTTTSPGPATGPTGPSTVIPAAITNTADMKQVSAFMLIYYIKILELLNPQMTGIEKFTNEIKKKSENILNSSVSSVASTTVMPGGGFKKSVNIDYVKMVKEMTSFLEKKGNFKFNYNDKIYGGELLKDDEIINYHKNIFGEDGITKTDNDKNDIIINFVNNMIKPNIQLLDNFLKILKGNGKAGSLEQIKSGVNSTNYENILTLLNNKNYNPKFLNNIYLINGTSIQTYVGFIEYFLPYIDDDHINKNKDNKKDIENKKNNIINFLNVYYLIRILFDTISNNIDTNSKKLFKNNKYLLLNFSNIGFKNPKRNAMIEFIKMYDNIIGKIDIDDKILTLLDRDNPFRYKDVDIYKKTLSYKPGAVGVKAQSGSSPGSQASQVSTTSADEAIHNIWGHNPVSQTLSVSSPAPSTAVTVPPGADTNEIKLTIALAYIMLLIHQTGDTKLKKDFEDGIKTYFTNAKTHIDDINGYIGQFKT